MVTAGDIISLGAHGKVPRRKRERKRMAFEETRDRSGSSSWMQTLCCKILQAGKIPRHVAIIMDGNRRFAKKMHRETVFGHTLGFSKLTEVQLKQCRNSYLIVPKMRAFLRL